MIKLRIPNNKLLIKSLKNPILIIPVIALGAISYTYLFTDIVICHGCVADKSGINIKQSELNNALKHKAKFYSYNNQSVDNEALRRDTIQELINNKRVDDYAKKNNIVVTSTELDSLYSSRIKSEGSEQNLLKKLNDMYGINKAEYLEVLKDDILKEKVQSKLKIPLSEWLNR